MKNVIVLVLLAAIICVAGLGCGDGKKTSGATGATTEKKEKS